MTTDEANVLEDGVYFLYWDWEGDDRSVGAIGRDRKGRPWFCPANWVSGICLDWGRIAKVELIEPQWKTPQYVQIKSDGKAYLTRSITTLDPMESDELWTGS